MTASNQRKTPMTRRCNCKLTKPKHHRGRGLATEGELKVAMAGVPSVGDEGDADDKEAIEQISWIGGTAIA
jgi:hypothetical protein